MWIASHSSHSLDCPVKMKSGKVRRVCVDLGGRLPFARESLEHSRVQLLSHTHTHTLCTVESPVDSVGSSFDRHLSLHRDFIFCVLVFMSGIGLYVFREFVQRVCPCVIPAVSVESVGSSSVDNKLSKPSQHSSCQNKAQGDKTQQRVSFACLFD